ncbi:MAG: hypothetical protein NC408_09100 [Candidatus Gastranaerophilales bacterium]|nr:hypothetical protein [Candidatus Gastranaerophilales bacterium]MCM1073241.1 hypothetical protein [Bacteroides sp.]
MTTVQNVGPNVQQPNPYQQQPMMQQQYYPEVLNVQEFPDHYVYTIKDEASSGKKWGVGLGSFFLTGLGQAINGQWGKAAAFFGGAVAAGFVSKSNPVLGGLAALGITIWSTVDAVKNAFSKTKQIVPKEQNINMQG